MGKGKIEGLLTAVLLAASACSAPVSDATYLRMGRMAKEPVIDGRISYDEDHSASVHYGAMSDASDLIILRYTCFFFGYTEKGVYFAARTSTPPSPLQLKDEDAVMLTLLPPGARSPVALRLCVANGENNLPKGSRSKVVRLKGISDYGYECAESEMFVPFAALGLKVPKDGEEWGLQMQVDYSSPRETGYWHYAKGKTGELGTFVPDSQAVVPGFVQFGYYEAYRNTGWYKILYRVANPTDSPKMVASKSHAFLGLGLNKLDSNPETDAEIKREEIPELDGLKIPANDCTDVIHDYSTIWPGTANFMTLDVTQDGRPLLRRKMKWNTGAGKDWKDEEGLPNMRCSFSPADGNRLRIEYGVNGIKDLIRGAIRVIGSDGKVHFEKKLDAVPTIWGALVDTRLPDLPLGNYRVVAAAANAAGKKYSVERTFALAKFPWQDLNLGKDRIILPPFKPIKVEKKGGQWNDKISFLQTGYRCKGVFWDEVYAQGQNILAAPISLTLNGEEFKVQGSKFLEQSPDRVIREIEAELPLSTSTSSLGLAVIQDYDYDGYCYVTLKFSPKQPMKVRSLKVSVPLKDEIVKLYEVARRNDVRRLAAPDFTIPKGEGEIWNSAMNVNRDALFANYGFCNQPEVWFGGPYKGICVLRDTVRDWSIAPKGNSERLTRGDGAVTLEMDFVSAETEWDSERTYTIAFQPTPVKPREQQFASFAIHMYEYQCPSNAVGTSINSHAGELSIMHCGESCHYPNEDTSFRDWLFAQKKRDTGLYYRKLDEYLAKNADWFRHAKGLTAASYRESMRVWDRLMGLQYQICYIDPCLISCHWPESEMYKADWYVEPWPVENLADEYLGRPTETRIDKVLYDARRALRGGMSGIYYDCFMLQCDNNVSASKGRAYFRKGGGAQNHLGNLVDWRELVKRTATLSYVEGKRIFGKGYCEVHVTDAQVVPVNSFGTKVLATERGSQGGDFQDRFPEGYVLADVVGTQAGCVPSIIVSTVAGDRVRQEQELRSLMGFMCAYGIFSLQDQGILYRPWFDRAWNIVFDFGWGKPGVVPHYYYDETPAPVKHSGKDVRLTVAQKKDSALLMFGNLGEATTFDIDVAGLGFGRARLIDAETGSVLAPSKVNIGRHGHRLIYVMK